MKNNSRDRMIRIWDVINSKMPEENIPKHKCKTHTHSRSLLEEKHLTVL